MRRALLACCAAACGSSTPPAPPTGPIAASASHYDYTFDVDSRVAHATVTLSVAQGGDCLTLPFRAMSPTNVMLDSVAATSATTDATSLTACGKGWELGDTLVLDADLTFALSTVGPSQIGYSITMDAQNNPFYYLVSWVGGCDRFAPCDNSPSVFATYHFDVTHPATLTVRCPGTITEDSPTETECAFDHPGGPTYSTFGVAAYPAWTQTDEGMWGSAHVVLYDRAQTGIAALVDPTFHAGYVAWLESQFGPYPFGSELRLLTAPTYWNGFEHPGNIVLADTLAHQSGAYADNVAHTIDHEITHQWAGDQTTLAGQYDFAWKESMAEYMAYVWEDMHDPASGLVTAAYWKTLAKAAKYYPVPGGNPDLFDSYGDVYGAGPMILFHQLEGMTSRADVLAAIASVLGMPHALSVDQVVTALQVATGVDLTQYAAGWLHGTGEPVWPRYAIAFTAGTGTSTLLLHLVNSPASGMGCKFHVELDGATADDTALVAVDTTTTSGDQTLQVPTPTFDVTALRLDPASECLVFLDSETPREPPHKAWVSDRGR